MDKKFSWLLYGCYFIFSISLLFLYIIKPSISKFLLLFFVLGIVIIYYFLKKKKIMLFKNVNKKVIIILFIIPILLRFGLLFFNYINIVSDYETFYMNAIAISKNLPTTNLYISAFPYLYPYMYMLGNFFKIFGTNYSMVILFNTLIDLLGAFIMYKFLYKVSNKKTALIGLFIWLINPFSFIWITKCCPVIIVNTLIALGFYVFSLFDDKKVKTIILSIVLGIILGISNSFRPIMIIFLIAIFLYYLFLIFKDKKFFKYISSFTLIVLFYFISMLIINNSISKILGYEVSNNSGWSVFVGSNRKYDGMWNIEDSSIFGTELYKEDSTPFKAHSYVKEIGIKRYKENGINNIKLFVNKASNIISYHSSYSYSEFIDFFSNNFPKSVKQTLKIYVYVMFLLGLVLNAYGSFKLIINNDGRYLPYVLFGMGLFMATLLMEGHIRYFTPLYVPLILVISLLSYHNEFNK